MAAGVVMADVHAHAEDFDLGEVRDTRGRREEWMRAIKDDDAW